MLLNNEERACDICGDLIPEGSRFNQITCHREAAALLSATDDPEFKITFTVNPNGTVTIDRCLDCYLHMGSTEGNIVH